MIGVISYGAGNIGNVLRALAFLGREAALLQTPDDLTETCSSLVLPGVGAFPPAVRSLHSTGWYGALREWAGAGKPLIGICLGMQLLCEAGLEDGFHEGLGLVEGTVRKLEGAPKLPHVGWNTVTWVKPPGCMSPGRFFYFVHSYALPPGGDTIGLAQTGAAMFSAAVARRSVAGFQFHPERSGLEGLALLKGVIDKMEGAS